MTSRSTSARPSLLSRFIARIVALFLIALVRLVTGAQARWTGTAPLPQQRLYYANHSSHLDFLLLWALLPPRLRWQTRPVAGADYWNKSAVRRYLIRHVFNGVLVERGGDSKTGPNGERLNDPLAPILAAVAAGDSLIFFPEGTRNANEEMLPFKSGLFHIARQCAQLELVPARIENLNRVMPKGELLPLPLVCTINFGAPVVLQADEPKEQFLTRARDAIIQMIPRAA
ncbi:lysophospholipid acyltransferase family protein [Uliginosibacterium sp. H3]|uniref:Lysophospholipid acyltransferase family protein n=1 Tax=Uliginosibacterium silvisoli TaxID=3114758 RepID=A0ABU6JYB8_9RHOO|nr:lysophospholipid acyltransferase family protein [Uliginosibacterium sp. H3]